VDKSSEDDIIHYFLC